MKNLAVLGSTGSIGQNALEIASLHPDRFNVAVLAAAYNISLLAEQVIRFKPETVVVMTDQGADELASLLKGEDKPQILVGEEGYTAAASSENADTVLLAMVGSAGLYSALAAVESGKTIALANKETLVMAGDIVMDKAESKNVPIYPVDSEHSAIYQCMMGNSRADFEKIFLTASGGPFRNTPVSDFTDIAPEDALKHPNWDMGSKITIDSATLMNKGLEIVEAVHLFNVSPDCIQVLIHPQSIVHSMVGFKDKSVIAQMGVPDMKGAISFALSCPERMDIGVDFPDFFSLKNLTFEPVDRAKFPSIDLAFTACRKGGTMPAVLNAANEVAVTLFLERKIRFTGIYDIISECMGLHTTIDNPDLSGIINADRWARDKALSLI